MAQFLLVHGLQPERGRPVFDRGLACFERIAGLRPAATVADGSVRIAKFDRPHGQSIPLFHPGPHWLVSAGTWFHRGGTRPAELVEEWRDVLTHDRPLEVLAGDLEGMFTLVMGDVASDEFTVVTDRLGTLAAYEAEIDGCRAISTSALVLGAMAKASFDLSAVREMISIGTVFGDKSLFGGVRKLEPGSILHYESGTLGRRVEYWSVAGLEYDETSARGKVTEIADGLDRALSVVRSAFPRQRVDLTGGLDSRAVLGALLAQDKDFFTVVNGKADDGDVIAAARIAEQYGLRHHHHPVPEDFGASWWSLAKRSLALTDGEAEVLEYAAIRVHQEFLADETDVSINGSGGEVAKGYWWELLLPFVGRRDHFDSRRVAERRFATDPWADGLLRAEHPESLAAQIARIMDRYNQPLAGRPNTQLMDNVYLRLRMQRWQGRLASATSRLIPNVSPYLFRRPLEAALTARPVLRFGDQLQRKLIEHLDPKLAALPLASGEPALPLRPDTARHFAPEVLKLAQKAGRRALPKWLRGPEAPPADPAAGRLHHLLAEPEIADLLNVREMKTRDLYKTEALEAWVKNWKTGTDPDWTHLGRILTLELVARSL